MTAVEFHTGVANPVDFACRLLRKAYRRGVRVLVTAPEPTLLVLDRALWTFEERDFVPHVVIPAALLPGAGPGLAEQTPIWLAVDANLPSAPRVLLNLGAPAPADLQQLDRLIEILSTDADAAQEGRARWQHYKLQGLDVVHHANAASDG